MSATVGYWIYWPNPFSTRQHAAAMANQPRQIYRDNSEREDRNHGYELTRLEEGRDFG